MDEGKDEQNSSGRLCWLDVHGGHTLEGLCHKVFITAEKGWLAALNHLLSDCTREHRDAALRFRSEVDGEKVTPLMVASKAGHLAIVKALVKDFGVDLEGAGSVIMDGCLISDATALWCAAAWGHFEVVKLLVDAGANVDRACASKSTPLRAACFIGRIDIVSYLVSSGADVNAVNDRGNTCLMLAAYRGHAEVVRYLVVHGANIDHSHDCGTSALHLAAEAGHGSIVTYLISCNARVCKNKHGMTPIMAAATNAKVDIVEYLSTGERCSAQDRVEAYELLAAAFANDSDHENSSMSYYYMCAAMLERSRCGLSKTLLETVEDYGFQKECCSLAQLEAIKVDEERLWLEALLMQERILGTDHPAVAAHLEYRSALLADAGKYHASLRLAFRAAQVKLKNEFFISEELLRVARAFALMLEAGIPIACTLLKRAMELVCTDVKAAREQDDEEAEKALQSDMHSMLYMVALACKSRFSNLETYDLRCIVYRFCKMDIRLPTGYSLLHMAVSQRTYVDTGLSDAISFPNSEVASWLLACGHGADCRDNLFNTPLHVVVQFVDPINDFTALHDIIMLLAKYGSHLDCTNVHGKTALQCCATGVAEVILRLQMKPRLKCLAARALKRNVGCGYESVLPKDLLDFVRLH